MKLEYSLTPCTHTQKKLKMDYRHKCKAGHYQTLRGKHKQNTDIYLSKIFFDPPSRVMKIKTKINKWDLMKLKSFCRAQEIINKMKGQSSEWEKIFANKATDKGLISKIYNQPIKLNIKKASNPIKK